jgi:hypothetical protein
MPLESTWAGRSLHRRFYGLVLAGEILSSNDAIYGDARFDELRFIYADFMDAEDVLVDTAQLKRLAALDHAASLSNARVKLAIIVAASHLQELARIYKQHNSRGGWSVEVFSSRAAAATWMGA